MKTANENVVRALAKVLAEARAGNVEAVTIVTASPEGKPDACFAGEEELMPSINVGLDIAKATVVARMTSIVIEEQTTSIRRPTGTFDS